MLKSEKSIKFIAIGVTSYMLVALVWWAILLQSQNEQINELLSSGGSDYDFASKSRMIIGEATVFGLALIIGMWLIYRSYKTQMETERNKSNFLLSVTHELRSPITGISLNLETLKKTSQLSGIAIKSLEYAQIETERLKILINNLLNSSTHRFNSDTSQIEKSSLNLDEVIDQVNKSHYPSTDLKLKIKGKPKKVLANRDSIITIYRNLIDNAIKYSKDASRIKINIQYDIDEVLIAIKDSAHQIPEKEFQNIFKMFHRLDDENVRESKGLGLGLYLVDQEIKSQRGSIDVSHYADGNCFTFRLPYQS